MLHAGLMRLIRLRMCHLPSSLFPFPFKGGEDFDQRVMEHFIKLYKKKTGKDIRGDNRAVQKLRREVEKAKRALSSQHQARIEIESFYDGEDFSETLTRARFEELNMVSFLSSLSLSLPSSLLATVIVLSSSLQLRPVVTDLLLFSSVRTSSVPL